MADEIQIQDKLIQLFEGRLVRPDVRAVFAGWGTSGWGRSSQALITLVSPTFEGMSDGARQEMVWDQILKSLSEEDQERIEFIYTKAPSELKEGDPRRELGRTQACTNQE
jgi:stress-induced morphogen